MNILKQYNIEEQRWELVLQHKDRCSPVFINPKRSKDEIVDDMVGWLNNCFRVIDES